MNLYAVLIGINEYESSPLQQCVNDVNKIEVYLNTLSSSYTTITIEKLTDKDATKANLVNTISTLSKIATNDDVVFIYYSGHGAQEKAVGRFSDAHTGMIDCLVCFDTKENGNYLLANKELRYLLSKFENNPHLLTIFDCCHSGDMVRTVNPGTSYQGSRLRKMSTVFPARAYENFIFSDEIDEQRIKTKSITSLIPYKNSINISACHSSESSWEDSKGGVFTRYLLQLLKAKNNKIRYIDIAKWAKISLKDVTNKKQTPTISVQGDGILDHYSSWLSLYPNENFANQGEIFYNNTKGWHYNKGQLFGIKKNDSLTILLDDNTKAISRITQVNLEDSLILDPIETGVTLDYKKSYPVITETVYTSLHLHILNLDKDTEAEQQITSVLGLISNITLSQANEASFFVTLFNQTMYLSLPNTPYQPLAKQIDLLNTSRDLSHKMLTSQLEALIKWNYYHTLVNPDSGFAEIPIKVEAKIADQPQWVDITNADLSMSTVKNKLTQNGEYYQTYQVRVSNQSKENLFVTALILSSDLSISSDPLDHITKKLKPNESVLFYEHRDAPYAGWFLDTYKEIYNWEQDWLYYKFIVNTHEDLTTSIPDMGQPSLPPPITHIGNTMGSGHISGVLPKKIKWEVYTSRLHLTNPSFNIIGEKLLKEWDWYTSNEIVAPFINRLYAEEQQNGFVSTFISKPNAIGDPDANAKSLMEIKIKLGNYLDDKRRCRLYKKSKKLFPQLPVVVAEGDSWFLFPFLVKDTLDYVMERYPLRSIAAAGDELQNYRKSGQLIKEIKKERPKYVLISGGGNDIIGPSIVDILLDGKEPGLSPELYLNSTYQTKMDSLSADYNYFFNRIHEFDFVEQVFVHGYDYVLANHEAKTIKNGWVNKYLLEKGITRLEDRTHVIRYLIDGFNALLQEVTQKHRNATYLDMRTLVNHDEWYDEIHPNDQGFAKVGAKFIEAINQLECAVHENL